MISIKPVGVVHSTRKEALDDLWLKEEASIELIGTYTAEALAGIMDFSHVEILFHMDQVNPESIETTSRHPRNNLAWPKVGIFAQRGRNRPNQIGVTVCEVIRLEGRKLFVRGLDAVDGTPVLDIKPWMKEFEPRGPVHQPGWSSELMRDYWETSSTPSRGNHEHATAQGLSVNRVQTETLVGEDERGLLAKEIGLTGGLHHVEINVSDLSKLVDFWSWFLGELGYEDYQSWPKGRSFRKGDTYLVFVQTEAKYLDVPFHRCRSGLNHLAFWAASSEMVDRITMELRRRNVPLLYEDRHPHAGGSSYAVFFEDPDRLKVELVAREL